MNNTLLVLVLSLALAACSHGAADMADNKSLSHEAKPVESLLTVKDMNDCAQQLGLTPPTAPANVYTLSADSLGKVKGCALGLEKQRMPLLGDLIDKYIEMLKQGDQECSKDIGTHYGDVCLRNSHSDAADWYNLAVSQRVRSELPNQPQKPALNAELK